MEAERHLEPETVRRLLSGAIRGPEASRLARHLEARCEACEALLGAGGAATALDGAADRALLRLGPPGEPGNDVEWARIRGALRRPERLHRLAGLATAAVLLVGVGMALLAGSGVAPGSGPWDGLKGVASPQPGVRLRFSVASEAPGAARLLERGASGAALPAEAQLLFRAEVGGPAALALLRLGPDGAEVIWEGRAAAAGTVDVEVGGRPAAVPLRGLSGRQRFALIGAPSLGRERLAEALRALSAEAPPAAPGPPLALDVVEVTVR
jgi:hypothetical protein